MKSTSNLLSGVVLVLFSFCSCSREIDSTSYEMEYVNMAGDVIEIIFNEAFDNAEYHEHLVIQPGSSKSIVKDFGPFWFIRSVRIVCGDYDHTDLNPKDSENEGSLTNLASYKRQIAGKKRIKYTAKINYLIP